MGPLGVRVRGRRRHIPLVDVLDDDDEESSSSSEEEEEVDIPLVGRGGGEHETAAHALALSGGFLSRLFFHWIGPLLRLGNTRALEPDDLIPLPAEDTARGIERHFRKWWRRERQRQRRTTTTTDDPPSLMRALWRAFGPAFVRAGALKLVHDSALFAGPALLRAIIGFLGDASAPLWLGVLYTCGLFVSSAVQSLCLRQYFFRCFRTGMSLRSATITCVYRKALRLSPAALQGRSSGEIVNLMSVDAQRLQDLTTYLHAIWFSFYQIGWALFFLWREVGPACFGGAAVIIVMVPVTGAVARRLKHFQRDLMKVKDERIKLNSEIISGIRAIKMQAWEGSFEQKISACRAAEMRLLRRYLFMKACSGTLWNSTPLLVSLVTFTVYVACGNELDVATALTSLALFQILRSPLFMLPNVINNLVEAKVSVDRLQSFMLAEEHQPVGELWDDGGDDGDGDGDGDDDDGDGDGNYGQSNGVAADREQERDAAVVGVRLDAAVCVYPPPSSAASSPDNGTYFWDLPGVRSLVDLVRDVHRRNDDLERLLRNPKPPAHEHDGMVISSGELPPSPPLPPPPQQQQQRMLALLDAHLRISAGELVAIVGRVGSGKSTVLKSILGELRLLSGRVGSSGSVAFVAQRPFIQNATLRENVLFGAAFDRRRYETAISVCALGPDLQSLPAGDATEIGEKGINLSGGQQARVSLARAVYADADIVLLDDPLSAVDAHVGRHIFEYCICGALSGKTVVLVTNAVQHLCTVDRGEGGVASATNPVERVVVMRNGAIVECGAPDLLARNGSAFAELVAAHHSSDTAAMLLVTENEEKVDGAPPSSPSSPADLALKRQQPSPESPKRGAADAGKIMTQEERATGTVSWKIYGEWASACGWPRLGAAFILFSLGEASSVLSNWWLAFWSEHSASSDRKSVTFYLLVYAGFCLTTTLFMLVRQLTLMFAGLSASRRLFGRLLAAIVRAPTCFFDTTPLGRVVNRFSKDVYTVDEQVPSTMQSYFSTMFKVMGVIAVICATMPLFTLALLPLGAFYYATLQYYIRTSRELKRLDSISRSPIYALFSETLDGLITIRAYRKGARFRARNAHLVDLNQRAWFLTFSANCWLAVRLELTGAAIIACASLFAVIGHYQRRENPGDDATTASGTSADYFASMAGLAISFALSVTQSLNWTVRMASDLEAQMVSVERIAEYAEMETEPQTTTTSSSSGSPLGADWPNEGRIEFVDCDMRYRPGLPLVLHGCSFAVNAREKIGVVGRTGAGKSSLMLALLRIVELHRGIITIDGVDIRAVPLSTLRSRVAVIPQDPTLFSGTIRSNVDPFGAHADDKIWAALRLAELASSVVSLDDPVTEAGGNYSAGQRQLLCFARALLARSRVILLDEATAAVDVQTDSIIQRQLRGSSFSASTMITVAHRINTIMDSDRILVMDSGRIAEFGTPDDLLSRDGSIFGDLVNSWKKQEGEN